MVCPSIISFLLKIKSVHIFYLLLSHSAQSLRTCYSKSQLSLPSAPERTLCSVYQKVITLVCIFIRSSYDMRTWKMYSCISCFDNISLAKEQITYSQASTEIRQLIVGKSEDKKTKNTHPPPNSYCLITA